MALGGCAPASRDGCRYRVVDDPVFDRLIVNLKHLHVVMRGNHRTPRKLEVQAGKKHRDAINIICSKVSLGSLVSVVSFSVLQAARRQDRCCP